MMMRDPKDLFDSPRARVLAYIQKRGSASIKELEADLDVTTTAIREQIEPLLREGFIQATRVRGSVGRPYYVYSLTAKAQDLFPKDYATLALMLLEETLAMHGREGLRLLLNRVSRRMADKLADGTVGEDLSQKLLGLVAALGESGMEVSMVPVPEREGSFVLKAHACPYFDVALSHIEICEMEQEMLGDLLGPGVDISLAGRIVDGQCACEFHVTPTPIDFVEKRSKVTSVGTPE